MSFDHPILFSSLVVRAIIDGRKTATGRIELKRMIVVESTPYRPDEDRSLYEAWKGVE